MSPSPSTAALEQLRLALHAYDRAQFGQLNATADALGMAAKAAGYVYGQGVGVVTWSRQTVTAQLQAAGDAADLSDGEFEDILDSLRAKGLVGVDKDGDPIVTEKGQVVLQQLKLFEAEPDQC